MRTKQTTELRTALKTDKTFSLLDRVASWWVSDDGDRLADINAANYDKDRDIHVDMDKFALEEWTDQRVQIIEILWGTGTRLPGDDQLNRELFNQVSLNSKSRILDIAVGLGNCARMLAKNNYAHVDVVEAYPNLLPHLIRVTEAEKLEPFISILKGDLGKVKLVNQKYDLIYGREALFKVEDKQVVIEKCVNALKQTGNFIFTDFVLEKDAASYKIFKNWSAREKAIVYPTSLTHYKKIIAELDLKLHPIVDYSESYIHHVNTGWLRLKKYLETHEFDDDFVDVMAQEADLWLSRVRALRSGKLKLIKFHATF
ncbi:MAG: methyltransferase domain-containing protein [Alphaproteobacteria bacterium]|nr:methyltransferase domain-containing protein [Alphaproteobacteria bacterium]